MNAKKALEIAKENSGPFKHIFKSIKESAQSGQTETLYYLGTGLGIAMQDLSLIKKQISELKKQGYRVIKDHKDSNGFIVHKISWK